MWLFVLLNCLDAVTTMYIVTYLPGAWNNEGNPLIRVGGEICGLWIFLPKMLLSSLCAYLLVRIKREEILWGLNMVLALAVLLGLTVCLLHP